MRLFILIATVAAAIWVATVDGWQSALWFIGVIGFGYWVISTVVEAVVRFFRWATKPKPTVIAIQIHPEEKVEIVDAEIVQEEDTTKWWRGG